MHTRLVLTAALLLAASPFARADDAPAKFNPNYTGPSAPTVALPDIVLPDSQPFAHPGLLQSQADIDFIRARLAAGEEPWTSSLKAMRASPYLQKNRQPKVIADVDPAGKGAGALMSDGSAAYGDALLWCITGDRAYADAAIRTLNANASTLRIIELGHADQGKLIAGFTGGKFASAAELLAHYRQPDGSTSGWVPADIARFRQMLVTVFYPPIENFKPEFNGNWDAAMVTTMMTIAVFCDDHAKFNRALDYYLHGKGHGSISHYIFANGQSQESARDQSHVQLGLGSLAAACEIAWKQGIDLYSLADNRLLAGYEYTAKYGLGNEVDAVSAIPVSTHGRGHFMPIWELAYQHYAIEKHLPMPYTQQVILKQRPEGIDLIILQAWGTLTAYRGPATPKTLR